MLLVSCLLSVVPFFLLFSFCITLYSISLIFPFPSVLFLHCFFFISIFCLFLHISSLSLSKNYKLKDLPDLPSCSFICHCNIFLAQIILHLSHTFFFCDMSLLHSVLQQSISFWSGLIHFSILYQFFCFNKQVSH